MFERRIQVQPGDTLILDEMGGKMAIGAWDEGEVLIRLEKGQDALQVKETEAGPVVSVPAACQVWVPSNLPVTIRRVQASLSAQGLTALNAEQVRGNLKMRGVGQATIAEVYGNLTADEGGPLRLVGTVYGNATLQSVSGADLQNVRGNLRVKNGGHLRVSRAGGNLQARNLRGKLSAEQVGGNAVLKDIEQPCSLHKVAGNLTAEDLSGGIQAPRIGGNLVLEGKLGRGRSYHFRADGNARLRFSEGTNAVLTLTARGKLLAQAPLADEQWLGKTLTGRLGDGGSEIVVEAGGNVLLSSEDSARGVELGTEIARQIEDSLQAVDLEAVGRQVSGEMEAALSRLRVKMEDVNWEQIGSQAREAIERAMEQMQRDADRLAEKGARQQQRLERQAEQQARRLERRQRKQGKQAPRPSVAAVDGQPEPHEPVEAAPASEDERLSILKLVEQGQITPAEAEMLLDALQQS